MNRVSESYFTWRRHKIRFVLFWLAMLVSCTSVVASIYLSQLSSVAKNNLLRQFELEVYLEQGIGGATRDSVLAVLKRSAPAGTAFQYVSSLDAQEKFAQEFGSELLDLLGDNPLPASFIVTFPAPFAQPFRIREVQKLANQLDGVDEAVFEGEIASRIERLFFDAHKYVITGGSIIALLGILFAFIALRSAVVDSAGIAIVMDLLGARLSYFRSPYLLLSALLGLLAGAVSLLAWLTMDRIFARLETTFTVEFLILLYGLLPVAMIVGWLVGIASTRAIKHVMRKR
ncbi:MAG: permease-like cell division protein FtsX [bacterium]|nr:permease-like cell division protein FtsX [bacterium]